MMSIQFLPLQSRITIVLLLATILSACSSQTTLNSGSNDVATWTVEFENGPTPWTHSNFDAARDKFTFAVFSDLTGGEREGVFDVAMEQIRLLRPEFIMNVGDLIEGGTEDRDQLNLEWDTFEKRASRAHGPIFFVGGNHDLINPVQWDVWAERYGPSYYHFRYEDVLFLVLDTEDNTMERQQEIYDARAIAYERAMTEGWGIWLETDYAKMMETHTGTISKEQSEYFQEVIKNNSDVRWTFLFMHKPVWLKEGEENFLAIENALSASNYTVFNGHQHDYVYRQRNNRDYIQMGTTGGVQLVGKSKAVDHITLVTVSGNEVDIANLELSGIFDKTGSIPLNGESLCFDLRECPENN